MLKLNITDMSAKTNIDQCPEWCWDTLNSTGELMKLTAGESGFIRTGQSFPRRVAEFKGITLDQLADEWNADLGVTKGQRQAMNWGTMFGWEVELANPSLYDDEGNFKPE
jgi:hypothetical protein